MRAWLRSLRRPWLIVITFITAILLSFAILAIIVLMTEVTRLITAYATIDHAANEARRYAVADVFDPRRCTDNDQCDSSRRLLKHQREQLEDAARLATIHDIVHRALGTALTSAHVVVCSPRPGCFYDSHKVQCLPRDDAGGPRDKVMIHIEYNYLLGSSIGLNLGSVLLQATRQGTIEWSLTPRIQGLPPTILSRLTPTSSIGPNR